MNEKKDALATKELGPAIVSAAIEKRNKELQAAVVGHVSELLRRKAVAEQQILEANKAIAEVDEKLAKLNSGQFTLTDYAEVIYQ